MRRDNEALTKELTKMQERLEKASHRLDAVAKASREALLVLDNKLRVRYATLPAQELFNKSSKNHPNLLDYTENLELVQLVQDALGDERASVGLNWQTQIGDISYQLRVIADGNDVIIVLRDISQLQKLERSRREFVGNISHELRTPLTSIMLLLENLLEHAPDHTPDTLDSLHKIQREVESLQEMAQELVDLVQIESGRALFRLIPISVGDLFRPTIERLTAQIAYKGQTLSIDWDEKAIALADPEQIRRAFGNLLHNAIKFTPIGGTITVKSLEVEDEWCLQVSDNGPGIAPKDLSRVFERFFKTDRTRSSGGTGLGLAIAKHIIVEGHAGRIWVESEGIDGKGCTFSFTFPKG